jgi:hypothetical protein
MGKLKTNIASIEPEGGPTGGNTRVLVRGGPFANLELIYPHPVCRFGSKATEVEATYVDCTLAPTNIEGFEPRHKDKVLLNIKSIELNLLGVRRITFGGERRNRRVLHFSHR